MKLLLDGRVAQRKRNYKNIIFDFLGFTFQPRVEKARRGNLFLNFSPAVGNKAAKEMRKTIRNWKILKITTLAYNLKFILLFFLENWYKF